MKILVTGGPVHGKLDAVKIITNKFRGGLMAKLAEELAEWKVEVIYLTAKGSHLPRHRSIELRHHDGIHDYMAKVLEIAPSCDGVVLGAAVANLIPANPLTGKFPSHDYKPGDIIPIDFTIAPRIIDEVKKVAPNTKLFGFKLLAGVEQDELVRAAYGVLLEAKCAMVFANQTDNLDAIQIVTKERGTIRIPRSEMASVIKNAVEDIYFRTEHIRDRTDEYAGPSLSDYADMLTKFESIAESAHDLFKETPEGYVFGTIAIRRPNCERIEFLTTGRGKNELKDKAYVVDVDNENHVVKVYGDRKATLNAPLLHCLFRNRPDVVAILHVHCPAFHLPERPYAPSGTVRDSFRKVSDSFTIPGHGSYFLLTQTRLENTVWKQVL